VSVVGRRADEAHTTAALAGRAGRVGGTDDVGNADLVVNATPVGMAGLVSMAGGPVPPAVPFDLDIERVGAGQLVVDLVYAPALTPLLDRARRRGARTANGLGMLIHQAALQFRLWTAEDPPLEVMSAAAMSALVHTEPGPAVPTS